MSTNQIYTSLLLGFVILFGLFVTRPLYESYLSKEIQFAGLENQKEEKVKVLKALEKMRADFMSNNTGSTELVKKVNKLGKKWDTSDVMSAILLNEYTNSTPLSQPRISIGDISVNKGAKLPSGLSLGNVDFSVSAKTLDDMIIFITHLTQASTYVFTIDSISLPIDTGEITGTSEGGLSLSLSLGIYYYE